MANPVVHFEVVGKDGARLQEFYSSAFGWTIDADNPIGYGLVSTGTEDGIQGGIASADAPGAMFYIQVDDPAAALARAVEQGGTVVQDVSVIPGMVTMAQFADPEGNVIGIVGAETPAAE